MSRAAELFFTGDTIDAETACEWGLVSRVVPHETLMDEALALAGKIAAMPPHALRMTKSMLRQGQTITYDRSEEHTSELQSLMRISYAVFCLKKKKNELRQLLSYSNARD